MTETVVITGSRAAIDDDDVTIAIGDRELSGWTGVRVTAGMERCPRDFDLSATEFYPGEANAIICKPGDECTVFLGKDKVVTGYLNRYGASLSARGHSVTLSGRGMCQDLVDCAAEWPGQQISAASVLDVAKKLAEPYGVTVTGDRGLSVGRPDSAIIPQMNLMLGETPMQVIERLCRISSFLAYEQADGSLLLTALEQTGAGGVGPTAWKAGRAASGFEEGVNVQSASVQFSDDQKFNEYRAYLFAFSPKLELLTEDDNLLVTISDPSVKRTRRHVTLVEQGHGLAVDNAKKRAAWEAARRWGRGQRLQLTTDSWRDSAKKLYTPQTFVSLSLPTLKIVDQQWLISEVTYRKDANGTACDLVLMPPEAFSVQPTLPNFGMPLELAQLPAGIGKRTQ